MTALRTSSTSEIGSIDPLDRPSAGLDEAPRIDSGERAGPRSWGLSWSATTIPVAPLLLMGMAFGPRGIGFLSLETLRFLDPAVPVALGVLGALAAMAVGERARQRSALAAAATDVMFTVCIVSALAIGLASATSVPPGSVWLGSLTAGICAATSLPLSGRETAPYARLDLQILAAIVAGGFVLALVRATSPWSPLLLVVQVSAVALLLAGAGWLLLSDASSDTERRVFAAATLLLVGGAADYLALSALMGGLVAGFLWHTAGGPAREDVERAAMYVQRPLVAMVLLVAGARTEPSALALGLAGLYVVARALGGLRLPGPGLRVLPPGVFGVAFALNALRAAGPDLTLTLSVVVLGTIAGEVAAGLARRGDARA